jgi:hypothetical protein
MSKHITKTTLGKLMERSQTDFERVDAMSDEDIDYSDIPEMDDNFFKHAEVYVFLRS